MNSYFDFETDFGGLIREERKKLSLTMKELADSVGVSEQAISQWERGIRKLKIEMASHLAEVLGYTVPALLEKYEHYNDIIPSWFHGSVDAWEEFKHSPMPEIKEKRTSKDDLFIAFIEEYDYYFVRGLKRGYDVTFPDGSEARIEADELNAIEEKSAEYINMLFTQLQHDNEKKK